MTVPGDTEDWRRPVDKIYAMLIAAMRRDAEALASEDLEEGETPDEIADVMAVRGANNTAWMVVRFKDADSPLWLFHGHTMVGLIDMMGPEYEKQGSGFDVTRMPFEPELLEPMALLSRLDQREGDYCECGHKLTRQLAKHVSTEREMPTTWCPSCGRSDGCPETWILL